MLRGWDIASREQLFEISTELDIAWSASAAPDGKSIAVAGNSGIRVIDLESRSIVKRLDFESESRAIKYSPDGKWLGTAADKRRLAILHADTLDEVASFTPAYGELQSIEFSRDGRRVIGAFEDIVFCWDIETGTTAIINRRCQEHDRHQRHQSRRLATGRRRFFFRYLFAGQPAARQSASKSMRLIAGPSAMSSGFPTVRRWPSVGRKS